MPLLLVVSSVMSLILAVSMVRRLTAPGGIPFFGILLGIFFYSLGYGFELVTKPGGANEFWNHFQYLGIATLPAFWLWLSLEAPRSERISSPLVPLLLLAEAVTTLVLNLTNDQHHLYYASIGYALQGDLTRALIEPGPWYVVHALFSTLGFPAGAIAFYFTWRRCGRQSGASFVAIVVATLPTLAAFLLYQARLVPGGLDLTPLGLAVTSALYFWLLWPFRLFELRPVTRDAVFRLVPDPVIVVDSAGRLVDWNAAAAKIFPRMGTAVLGDPLEPLLEGHPDWQACLRADQTNTRVILPLQKGATWWSVTNSPVRDGQGRLLARVFLLHEQTELVQRVEVSEHRALTDGLTGCLNRRAFHERVVGLLEARSGRHESASLICADLDHFKAINDNRGHAAGDAALKHVVRVWQEQLRSGDLLGRLGGEEFAVFLPGTGQETALSVAQRLCTRLREQPLEWEGRALSVTASFGVVGVSDSASTSLDVLLRNADAALYEAKEQGRDRVVLGSPVPTV